MIANIIGCGPSGKYWNGKGFSIGVNDCFKFGHQTDILLVVNSFDKYPDRKKIIQESRPKDHLLALGMWSSHPCYKQVPYLNQWRGQLEKGKLYKSKSSPFIAVTLAHSLGYNKIILWGVDFDNHPILKGHILSLEIRRYESLQNALSRRGCSMYLGCMDDFENKGALSGIIPNFRWIHSID